ncbi:MAG: hypothetical protein ACOZF0_02930 [Thermodesulfobacteriota bacterium]
MTDRSKDWLAQAERGLEQAAEPLVYTLQEWEQLKAQGGRFWQSLQNERIWTYHRNHNEKSKQSDPLR